MSPDGVLVFDSNGTPAAAAAVLAGIRKLTDQPVRYVVNSHWHWDHWYGTETYTKAFPDVKIVAHEKTRELRTLEMIDALDADVLIPGHGEPLRDKTLLGAHMNVMRELLKAGKDVKARGLDPDQARDEVLPRLKDLMVKMTKDDPKPNDSSGFTSSTGTCTASTTSSTAP